MQHLNLALDPPPRDAMGVLIERDIAREQRRQDDREYLGCAPPPSLKLDTLPDDLIVEWDGEPTTFGSLMSFERRMLAQGADGVWRGSYGF